jgi:hypothetical protein
MTKQLKNQTSSSRCALLPMYPLLGEPSPTSTTALATASRLVESSAPCLIPQRRNMKLHSFAAAAAQQHHHHHNQFIMSYESPAEGIDHGHHHHEGVEEDLVKSRNIPIQQHHMKRTASEVKLCEDEEMADFRDYVFFSRVIDGIARQQRATESSWLRHENNECLAHIIGTRTGTCLVLEEQEDDPACRVVNSNVPDDRGEQSRPQHQGTTMNNDILVPDEDAAVADTSADEIFVMDL